MTNRPNILLITTDQQHFTVLGAVNDRISTPNLDRLCAAGTRFDRAYCPSPVCTPSRASIITGEYPSRHGAWTIGVSLPEDREFLGDHLAAQGYRTGLIGKAHFQPLAPPSLESQPKLRDLEFWRGFNGPWYGFQHIELARNHADESHVGQHYAIWMEEKGLADWRDYFQPLPGDTAVKAPRLSDSGHYWARKDRAWALPDDLHYTRWTGERSAAFIEETGDQPFFLWASFHDPHPPYTVPEPWASMYDPAEMEPGRVAPGEHDRNPPHFAKTQEQEPDFGDWHSPFNAHGCESHLYPEEELKKDMAVYYGMMSFIDAEVGRILDKLDALGLTDNTLIVFTTDHGHFLGQHGLVAKGPFHYEDMLRLPFIVAWPGHVPAGETSDAIQSLVDLAPSFLAAAGAPGVGAMQGVSQLDCWAGGEPARDFAICENRHNPEMPHAMTYVEARHKITTYRHGPWGELFDLDADPLEVNNLWDDPDAGGLKAAMLHRMVQGIMRSEATAEDRVAGA
ncbi:sulfatase [Pelagovum pacificum]|uniref:Sulfatase n=1 Tax=Pelagovum pacificum TaxID=2588711 RepID=A0A5C5GHF2_9RHOB|nr:sulfatase-like hydrolase/transferase [Pelagovum pacificum]QQA42644.1 sulfatase-like hydrolase/transferase [Pelagovum pacificum]TNY34205.1 sulfatase [Pelagovum pacificum]